MSTYVLVDLGMGERCWYKKVTVDDVQELRSAFDSSLTNSAYEMIGGREGLDVGVLGKFSYQQSKSVVALLEEGEIVLFNRNGGWCYVTEDMVILKEVEADKFPRYTEWKGLTGWLTPEGLFWECEYGHHHEFAQEVMQGSGESREDKYVKLGSVEGKEEVFSHVHVPQGGFTEEQKEWFKENYEKLDVVQQNKVHKHVFY